MHSPAAPHHQNLSFSSCWKSNFFTQIASPYGRISLLLSSLYITIWAYKRILYSKLFSCLVTLRPKICTSRVVVDQKTSIMEMKWFYDGFVLMGVLHRGFPGKMSRQTVSKAQNEGKIHLDATVLKRDLLICHFKWNTNFNSSPVKSIPLSSSLRHLSFFLSNLTTEKTPK